MKYAVIAMIMLGGTLAAAATSHAAIYRWVAKDGTVTYASEPPPSAAEAAIVNVPRNHAAKTPGPVSGENVVLYMVPHCDSCDLVRHYLKQHHIPFREVNVAANAKKQQQLRKVAGNLTVPTVTVGTTVTQGYMPPQLSSALTQAGFQLSTASGNRATPAD